MPCPTRKGPSLSERPPAPQLDASTPGALGGQIPSTHLSSILVRKSKNTDPESSECLSSSACDAFQVKKRPVIKKKKGAHLGSFRAFIRLRTLGQKGRPDLRKLGLEYKEAQQQGHEDVDRAQAVSTAAANLSTHTQVQKGLGRTWKTTSKQVHRMKAKRELEAFVNEHAQASLVEKAMAVVAKHRSDSSAAAALHLARSTMRLEQTRHRHEAQQDETALQQWQSVFGESALSHVQQLLPPLKEHTWCTVPTQRFPIVEMQDDSTVSRATALCAALSRTQPTAGACLEGFWKELHATVDSPIGRPSKGEEHEVSSVWHLSLQ